MPQGRPKRTGNAPKWVKTKRLKNFHSREATRLCQRGRATELSLCGECHGAGLHYRACTGYTDRWTAQGSLAT